MISRQFLFKSINLFFTKMNTKNIMTTVRELKPNENRFIKPVMIEYLQNNKKMYWEAVLAHESVACILYNCNTKNLIFVKQFRPAVMMSSEYKHDMSKRVPPIKTDGYTLELCAGIVDKPDKNLLTITKEEIQEEVGYKVSEQEIEPVTSYRVHMGINGALQHLFFAKVDETKRVGRGGGVEEEQIEIVELSVEECKKGLLHCSDEEAIAPRTPGLMFALMWFINEKLPTINK